MNDETSLPILWADAALVAVHKPSGLLVHRTPIDRHERRFALQLVRNQLGRAVYPVHRLDKGASGLLVFALDASVARTLSQSFSSGHARKQYLAVVRGWPDERGTLDRPLAPVADERAPTTSDSARPACTHYVRRATVELPRRVDRYPTSRYALVEIEPVTGRRHQIRRHLRQAAHPIVGDSTYGKAVHNRLFAELFGSRRLLLASVGLAIPHPVTGERLVLTASPSADFVAVLAALGWDVPRCRRRRWRSYPASWSDGCSLDDTPRPSTQL